jgi:hypothetical protein
MMQREKANPLMKMSMKVSWNHHSSEKSCTCIGLRVSGLRSRRDSAALAKILLVKEVFLLEIDHNFS